MLTCCMMVFPLVSCIWYAHMYFYLSLWLKLRVFSTQNSSAFTHEATGKKSGPYILASTYSAGERKRKGNACLRQWNQAMKCHYFTSTMTQTTFHSIRQCSPAGAYKMRRTGTKAIADREGCRYWYRGRITAEH